MTILRELWINDRPDEELIETYQYMLDLRNMIESTCEMAREHLRNSQDRYVAHFDWIAKVRSLDIGDKVIILLPTDSNKLLMQWKGPYEVVKKVGINDYRVNIVDDHKLFHINMMKKYYERSDDDVMGLAAIIKDQSECETDEDCPSSGREEGIWDVHVNGQLSPAQKRDLRGLMDEFLSIS